jgi:hypothetical protein
MTTHDLDERLKEACNFDMGDTEIDDAYRTSRGIVFGILLGSLMWAGIIFALLALWRMF